MKEAFASLVHRTSAVLRKVFYRCGRYAETIERRTTPRRRRPRKAAPFGKTYEDGFLPSCNISALTAVPCADRKGKVTLFLPSLGNASFFGGAATALIVAGKLAVKLGKDLRIVETVVGTGDASELIRFFAEAEIAITGESIEVADVSGRRYDKLTSLDVHPDDDFVASAWWDAHVLNRIDLPRKYVYLIQDYEPIFYANSDRYVLAENTYRSTNFVPLCNTRLMRDFLAERYPYIGLEARWFEPAASHRKYGLCRKPEGKRTLFLYGRPGVERNLFYLALSALETVFASKQLSGSDWRVVMAGQDDLANVVLSSGVVVENLGKLSAAEYRNLTLEVDLAISLMMAPHPNYPTLELSSVGAAVVTTRYENKRDLSFYSKNILVADLTLEDVAAAIVRGAALSYETRMAQAETSNIGDDWEAALAPALDSVIRLLRP